MLNLEQYGFGIVARAPQTEREDPVRLVKRLLEVIVKNPRFNIYESTIEVDKSNAIARLACYFDDGKVDLGINVMIDIVVSRITNTAKAVVDFDVSYAETGTASDDIASSMLVSGPYLSIFDDSFKDRLEASALNCYQRAAKQVNFPISALGNKSRAAFNRKVLNVY